MSQPKLIGKYQVIRELGKGAMGKVYEGWDPTIERRVAIKIILAEFLHNGEATDAMARFKREAQASGRLSHPAIVQVYEYAEMEGNAYIVMEYAEGQVLKSLMRTEESFSLVEVFVIMKQLLMALDYSHRQGVIHRDIKPANIMITGDFKVKLMDFGIARIGSTSMTQIGTIVGTPSYSSPEQISGLEVDSRADLWSAGVLLYELLTGRNPFRANTLAEMVQSVLHVMPAAPSRLRAEIPPALDEFFITALAKQPADRFPNARIFLQRLIQILRGRGINTADVDQTLTPNQTRATAVRQAAASASSGQPASARPAAAPATASARPPAEPTVIAPRLALSPELLASMEKELTESVGPVARVLLRRSLDRSATLESLFQSLADALPAGPERDRFLKRCLSLRRTDESAIRIRSGTLPGAKAPEPVAAALQAADLVAVEKNLASHVGPLARILMRDAAHATVTLPDLYRKLAGFIDDPDARREFLEASKPPAP